MIHDILVNFYVYITSILHYGHTVSWQTMFHFMESVSSCLATSTSTPSVTSGMSAHITFRDRSLVTKMVSLRAWQQMC